MKTVFSCCLLIVAMFRNTLDWNNNTLHSLLNYMQSTSGTTCRDVKKHSSQCHYITITSCHCVVSATLLQLHLAIVWLIFLTLHQKKTTLSLVAYPSSFVSERKRHNEINGIKILHLLFVCYFVIGVNLLRRKFICGNFFAETSYCKNRDPKNAVPHGKTLRGLSTYQSVMFPVFLIC